MRETRTEGKSNKCAKERQGGRESGGEWMDGRDTAFSIATERTDRRSNKEARLEK